MSLPHSEKLTLPYVALLATVSVWKFSMAESSDPEFSFINTKPNAWGTRYGVDAFEVCSQFLALQTPEQALHFFERYGPFQLQPQESADPDPRLRTALPIRWSAIQRAQSDFKAAQMSSQINLMDPMQGFVFQPLKGVELRFRGPEVFEFVLIKGKRERRIKPEFYDDTDPDLSKEKGKSVLALKEGSTLSDAAIVNCEDVVTAVRAAIFLRRMNGFTWRRCARPGCDKVFEVSASGRKKKYHDWKCGHLVAVKKSKLKKDKEAKSKKKRRK